MHFTIHHNDDIYKKIGKDLDLITQEVLTLLGGEVHSIILCGGFGRGEGSVVVQNGIVRVINDYDLYVVLKERNRLKYAILYKRYHNQLNILAEQLAQRFSMKQIDLALKHRSYFDSSAPLKIENYEVLNGHILLYGAEDPCISMPDWRSEDIPLFEGTWLFRNRGGGLLLAGRYFVGHDGIPAEKRENFVIECGKAQLAIGDSLLLLRGRYHHLYSKRLEALDSLSVDDVPEGEMVLVHYREALEQKLRPAFDRFYRRDLVLWWFEIAELFGTFYRRFEEQRLGVPFNDWVEYSALGKPEDQLDIRTWAGGMIRGGIKSFWPVFRRRNLLKARRSGLITVMALLLFSVQKEDFHMSYLEQAADYLDMRLAGDPLDDWRNLTDLFLQIWHPTGEAAQVTAA